MAIRTTGTCTKHTTTAKYRVTVECSYVARYEVTVDSDSEAMARIRAKQRAMLEEFHWNDVQGPQARIIELRKESSA